MNILSRLFGPIIALFFTTEDSGISSSEANSRKNMNKEAVKQLLDALSNAPLTFPRANILTTGKDMVTKEERVDFDANRIEANDIGPTLDKVAALNGESAILGHAIQLRDGLRQELNAMSVEAIVELFGRTEEFYPKATLKLPVQKWAFKGITHLIHFDNKLVTLKSVESLIAECVSDCLLPFSRQQLAKGLSDESRAAVYGKQLNQADGFFQKLWATKAVSNPRTTSTEGIIIERVDVRGYHAEEISDFKAAFDTLQTQAYQPAQRETNGLMKALRDSIRAVQMAYNAKYKEELTAYQKEQAHLLDLNGQAVAFAQSIKTDAQKELAELKIIV